MSGIDEEEVRETVRSSGLFARDRPLVAMISGGRDSTCLLDVAVALLGAPVVGALHLNYGLREEAEREESWCRELCELLGVELRVVTPAAAGAPPAPRGEEPGNLQAWARELRYAEAERLAEERDALVATGHTASDQVETILYRLAASPGRRALLGMPAAEGRLIRPLLALTREQTAAYCRTRGLPFSEDASNEDPRFARTRVRHGLLPALRAVHPAAERNVLRTAALLREETELLEAQLAAELEGRSRVEMARLREMPAALARMVVVRLAEQAAGTYVPQAGERVAELLELARRGGRAELHVGGRAGAVIEDGVLRMVRLPPRESPPPPGD
ncbi:MAG TPA: tRNA lysidine(34) synthetase TilS [Solirubrobacteraceae bacterium]